MLQTYHKVMTIAGSDSGGGAGIQADVKSICACGCFATSVITAVTAQNTVRVSAIHPVPVDIIEMQIRSVLDDIGTDSIKIGMLHNSETIRTVSRTLRSYNIKYIVVDPVMVATSGSILLEKDAIETLKEELLPMATVITPNIPEARILLNKDFLDNDNLMEHAFELSGSIAVPVLIKGGHGSDSKTNVKDVFCNADSGKQFVLESKRIETLNTHGTGCTLSAAIASFLAKERDLENALYKAKDYLSNAIEHGASYGIGSGHGPVHHFWNHKL